MSHTQSEVLQLLTSALLVVAREGYLKQVDSYIYIYIYICVCVCVCVYVCVCVCVCVCIRLM